MRPTKDTSTSPTTPPKSAENMSAELIRVAEEYAELFNASPIESIEHLIDDACIDPFWDDRTNLLSLLADGPEDMGMVLSVNPDDYVVVRFVGQWAVDTAPVDWDAFEERAFGPGPDEEPFDAEPGSRF